MPGIDALRTAAAALLQAARVRMRAPSGLGRWWPGRHDAFSRARHALKSGPPREYLEWLDQIGSGEPAADRVNLQAQTPPSSFPPQDLFNKSLRFDGNLVSSGSRHGASVANFFSFDEQQERPFFAVTMVVGGPEPFRFVNCKIETLSLETAQKGAKIVMTRCWIGKLQCSRHEPYGPTKHTFSLDVTDCWIGRWNMLPETITDLKISGGGILSIGAPPSYRESPVSGDVEIRSVFIPKKDRMYKEIRYGTSPWTNMRHHLISSGNVGAAGIFHTAALAVDRRSRRWYDIHRLVGAVYEYAGDYGSSIARPIKWLIACWVFGAMAYYVGDGAAITPDGMISQLSGGQQQRVLNWREIFVESRVSRAVYLSASASFNPLSVLLRDQPVEPTNIAWYLFFTGQRLGSLILLFLTAVAIRRQFRMSS